MSTKSKVVDKLDELKNKAVEEERKRLIAKDKSVYDDLDGRSISKSTESAPEGGE